MIFQITALGILAVFYGCYFGKLLLQRRQGIRTDQLGKGKKGLVQVIEITVKTASIAVPLGELAAIFCDCSPLPAAVRWAGAVIALLGAAVFICSVRTMGDSWRAGVPEAERMALVTAGIYRISRNPAFFGFDLVYVGILLMFFHWALLGLSAFAALMFHLQIVYVEEPFLRAAFGGSYQRYRKTVLRYLGRR